MKPAKNKWPATESSKNILFVAQAMRELLAVDSFESFRAMALGTISRIDEAIKVAEDVQQNRIPAKALDPVFQELQWSFKNDLVTKDILNDEIDEFLEPLKPNNLEIRSALHLLYFVRKRTSPIYKKNLEASLLSLVKERNKKNDLLQACQLYCSHIVNIGYSKSFIYNEVLQRFFTPDIKRTSPETLKSFFSLFEGKDRKFTVYVIVSETFGEFLARLGFSTFSLLKAPQMLLQEFPTLTKESRDFCVFEQEITAFDYYSAAKLAEDLLESVEALATTLPKKVLKCVWRQPSYVVPLRARSGKIIENQKIGSHQKSVNTLSGGSLKNLTSNSKRLFEGFNASSVERLLSSVKTFSLTQKTNSIENRLISVSSAVEVLLSDPPINTVRMLHYEKLLVPCICLNYVRRKFVAVYDALLMSYRRNFVGLVSEVFKGEDLNQHSRFVFLIMLPEFQTLRENLFGLNSDNPLAMNRVWRLSKDHGTPNQALDSVSSHENRVRWQIHRIYRARNNLVHAGQIPAYVDGLYLNAVEYFRSSITTIANFSRYHQERSSVDQLVSEIGFEYGLYKRQLKMPLLKNDVFTRELVSKIVRK